MEVQGAIPGDQSKIRISADDQSLHNISYQTLNILHYFAAGVTGAVETLPSSSATLALAVEP
ncbi:MAG: hypothetical protein ACXW6T_23710, partial [Candidatus Binatia bacterium]